MKRISVILLNMGGPSTPDEVKPFLRTLFQDPDLIKFPLKNVLAPLIVSMRTPVVKKRYGQIPGGSPLLRISLAQAEALEKTLNQRGGAEFKVLVGMRYTAPTIRDAVRTSIDWKCDEIVGLSMYPQYCRATIGSSILELKRVANEENFLAPLKIIDRYYDHPQYIRAVAGLIEQTLEKGNPDTFLLFSAHGVPVRMVRQGDPYVREIEATVRAVTTYLELHEHQFCLAYQSRMGPVRWVGPSTDHVIEELGRKGIKSLVFVPISFTVDNLETLYDIETVFKKRAMEAKIDNVHRISAPNVSPEYVLTLETLVRHAVDSAPSVGQDDES